MDSTGNNPPIPETVGERATGAVFSSTDSSRLDKPAIAGPTASTIEGPMHTAVRANDCLEDYLKKQHITLASFTWSTSQLPGTILFSVPITPLRGNSVMAYYSKLFNAWNGGLEYQAKVAGTGFHAGALGMVRIPPNIDPTTLKTVNEFTVFEYSVIDPKTLEAVTKYIPDQKQVLYHYMDDDFTNVNNIGGYYVVFVILQLNTSSTGTNQIDVQIFNKLNPEFRFHQVIPPSLDIVAPTDTENWKLLFANPKIAYSPVVNAKVSKLTFKINTFNTTAQIGLAPLSGAPPTYPSYTSIDGDSKAANFYLYTATSTTSLLPVNSTSNITQFNRPITYNGAATQQFRNIDGPSVGASINSTGNSVSLSTTVTTAGATSGAYYIYIPVTTSAFTVTYPGVPQILPRAGESLVVFDLNFERVPSIPTLSNTYLESMFQTGRFPIGPNEAVLLQLSAISDGLPIGYLKLYAAGYFSTNLVTADISYDLDDLQVTFVDYINSTTPIPTLSTNMLLTRQQISMRRMLNSIQVQKGDTLKISNRE